MYDTTEKLIVDIPSRKSMGPEQYARLRFVRAKAEEMIQRLHK